MDNYVNGKHFHHIATHKKPLAGGSKFISYDEKLVMVCCNCAPIDEYIAGQDSFRYYMCNVTSWMDSKLSIAMLLEINTSSPERLVKWGMKHKTL